MRASARYGALAWLGAAVLLASGCTNDGAQNARAVCTDWCDVWVVCWPAAENMGGGCEAAYPDGVGPAREDCVSACTTARENLSGDDARSADLCLESFSELFPQCDRGEVFTWLERCFIRTGTNGAFVARFISEARYTELECR